MRNHWMLDFETISTKPNAAVLSLGLVKFNSVEIYYCEEFHFNLKEQCEKRIIDGDTLGWWMNQSEEARSVFRAAQNGIPMVNIVNRIKNLYEGEILWGNGANFDPVILESMFVKCGVQVPWKFWDVRCYRTVKTLYPSEAKAVTFDGVRHTALADAKYQAKVLMNIATIAPQVLE